MQLISSWRNDINKHIHTGWYSRSVSVFRSNNSGRSGHHLESWIYIYIFRTSHAVVSVETSKHLFQHVLKLIFPHETQSSASKETVRENTWFWGTYLYTPHTFARFRVPSIDTFIQPLRWDPVFSINFPRRLINNFMFVSNVSLLNKSWGFWTQGFSKMVSHQNTETPVNTWYTVIYA